MRIVFDCVSLTFGNRRLFYGLTAEFVSGRIAAILGANGSGKSTLLKLAGQFIEPDGGAITAFDGDRELDRAEFRRRLAATAPAMNLYARLTAEENLQFFSKMRGAAIDDVDALFERVGLKRDDRKKFVGEFSTGMLQRLKFAILPAAGADVWLLDEPGANLDEGGRSMMLEETKRAASEGRLIMLATNDPIEAAIADDQLRLGG